MTISNSTYTINEIDDFLQALDVNENKIISIIHQRRNSYRSLKLALELYSLHMELGSVGKLDFPSKNLLEECHDENVAIICDILRIAANIQIKERFCDSLQYLKSLDSKNRKDLFVYLQVLSTFIKINDTYYILDESFVISLCKEILTKNLPKEKNYFITDVLKPYFRKHPLAKDVVLTEIISSFDIYTISCLILEIPPKKLNDSFWIQMQNVILTKNSQWEYKLALNILKTFVTIIDEENYNMVSTIMTGDTRNLIEFKNQWQNFFVLIELAEEKQLHLVQPSLVLLKDINRLHSMWIQCIYKKLLNHMQLSVVYSTATAMLDNECYNKKSFQLLLCGINKNDYSEHVIQFYDQLKVFVKNIDIFYYDILLEESTQINWTPLAAWLFYNHCINRLCDVTLDCKKLKYLREILYNLRKLPHKYIRNGCFDLFYNQVMHHLHLPEQNKLELLELFKSYNTIYDDGYLEPTFANSLENLIHIILKPDLYGNSDVSRAYHSYNTYHDKIYSKNILDFWTERIQKEKVCPDICTAYITHLGFFATEISDSFIKEKIEFIFMNTFSTQHERVFIVLFENLALLLKPFLRDYSSLDRILLDCYRQLAQFKQSDIRMQCSGFYFEAFFQYCDDLDVKTSVWSSIFDEVIADEVMAFNWLSSLTIHFYELFLFYVVKLIYFGDCYSKEKRFENEVCYKIFKEGGVLTSKDEPSLETKIRLRALEICANLGYTSETLWDTLLNIPCKRYFPDSSTHAICLRSTQTVLILMENASFYHQSIFDKILWHLCEVNHQPSVRQLMQWIMIKLVVLIPEYFHVIIRKIKSSLSNSALTSMILILYHVSLIGNRNFLEEAIAVMLEYTTGAIFKLRVYSQVAIFKLITNSKVQEEKYDILYKLLKKTLEQNKESISKVLRTDWEFFEIFNPNRHYHLRTILIDIPKLNNVVNSEWEYIEFNLGKFPDYERILPMDGNKVKMPILNRVIDKEVSEIKSIDSPTTNIQKKIIPLSTCDLENAERNSTDLIVIASLVTSCANLGGLARTCEIYGVKTLVIQDLKVVGDKEFKSLSMSAECWLNIIETKTNNLIEYIVQEKNNGYTILGAEQTCESVKLNEFKFPSKCVLLLGNEKEGVPFHLLPYLDVCIEIPQFGVVRSLNVHVAGSTFIWEYVRQRIV